MNYGDIVDCEERLGRLSGKGRGIIVDVKNSNHLSYTVCFKNKKDFNLNTHFASLKNKQQTPKNRFFRERNLTCVD